VTTALAETDEYVGTLHESVAEIDGIDGLGVSDEMEEGGDVAELGNVVNVGDVVDTSEDDKL
jgi:hypothetical protein